MAFLNGIPVRLEPVLTGNEPSAEAPVAAAVS